MATPQSVEAFLWLLLIGFSLLMYVALDGYDLGIGLLLLTEQDESNRKEMVGIVATAWDGNESWLILLGVELFGGFPLAYSTLLPALYIPLILMLFALIFRGISIEFQSQSPVYARRWGFVFALGSLIAAFCQGVILGAVLVGFPVKNGHFAGTPLSFLHGFSLLTGLFFVAAYCLSGVAWLNDKTSKSLQESSKRKGRILSLLVGVLLIMLVMLAPFVSSVVGAIIFNGQFFLRGAGAVLALVLLWAVQHTLKTRNDLLPFLCAIFALVLSLLSLLLLNYPYLVSPSITIWQAAAPRNAVDFLLIGVGCCIPIVLIYNAYAFYVFRGKFVMPQQ